MLPTKLLAATVMAALVASLVAAGCQSAGVTDKTGSDVVVLKFATIDELDPNGQTVAPGAFIQALDRISRGRIKVQVQPSYEDGAVTAETDIVKAIATGDLDGGWPATRAFSRAGIRGLEPIEAPLTLTSYAAQKALTTSPAAKSLLATLNGTGVVGLGLTVGSLRRPWSNTQALVDVRSWRGVRFRAYNSPAQEKTIRALGGVPVSASYNFPDLVETGKLQAVETDVAQYARNSYGTLLPHAVSNEVLWPRMEVLSISQSRFDSLTAEQQGWIRAAARAAVQASRDYDYDEGPIVQALCGQGVRFVAATPRQLAALQRAVSPVIRGLARDPATGPSLSQVRQIAVKYPNPDALDVPATCRQ